eukprot:gene52732-64432_t
MDMLLATGEQVSMALLAMALHAEGVPAVSMTGTQAGIITESAHGRARILEIRTERLQRLLEEGFVVVVAGFLSDAECDEMMAAARQRLARSETVDVGTGGSEVNEARTSEGMFFRRGELPLISRIEARLAAFTRWPVENGEGIQVLHYHPGAEYRPHYDYFNPSDPCTASILKRGGQRVGTLLMYLNDPDRGGGTTFPDVRLEVAPKRGNAVFFSYERPHPTTRTLHGGAPVIEGEKWIATKWLRERRFE